MDVRALFGLSVLMSFIAFGIVTRLYIWISGRTSASGAGRTR